MRWFEETDSHIQATPFVRVRDCEPDQWAWLGDVLVKGHIKKGHDKEIGCPHLQY